MKESNYVTDTKKHPFVKVPNRVFL